MGRCCRADYIVIATDVLDACVLGGGGLHTGSDLQGSMETTFRLISVCAASSWSSNSTRSSHQGWHREVDLGIHVILPIILVFLIGRRPAPIN